MPICFNYYMTHRDKQSIVTMATNARVSKYNFLTETDSALLCVTCLEIAEDPWQHSKCGRLLCKECLESYGRDKPCPNCRKKRPQYFEDNRGKREIEALRVKCSNMDRGCEWVGTVDTLEEHVATCGFTLVPCTKQCKDDNHEVKNLMKKDLDEHLEKNCPNRDHECVHCGEKGTFAIITQVHNDKCLKKILPCPNARCSETMERQQINEHVRTECPHTMIPCKYQGIGCGTELKREDLAAHEQDDKLHLHMALETVNSLQETVHSQQRAFNTMQAKTYVMFKKNGTADRVQFPSSFYTHPNGYHVTLRVYANGEGPGKGTHVSVYACILKGEYDHDAGLKWPFVGKITFTLLNQLEDKNHRTETIIITAEDNMCVGNNWGFSTFIPHSALAHDPVKNTEYLKDDTLYFRMSVEVANRKPWLELE